jgi:hypothetical protein
MSIKVDVDTGNLARLAEQAAERAVVIVMEELYGAFQQSFTAEAWAWPRTTQRTKGTVGSPRNLIDTANLRATGLYGMIDKYQANFRWGAEYASAVHEGYVTKLRGGRQGPGQIVPARPWTRAVLGQENVPGVATYDVGKRLRDVWMVQFRPR